MTELKLWISEAEKSISLQKETECFRLIDNNPTPLKADRIGSVLSLMWFSELAPNSEQLSSINSFANEVNAEHWFLRQMIDRGADPNADKLIKSENCPSEWTAKEYSTKYLFKLNQGKSPGLFFDQRELRKKIKNSCKDQTVLNLFSYTGGFSLSAALGGASQVTTVDVSKNYIDWSKQNFILNRLDVEKYEFWTADSAIFLKGALKHNRKFDIIICDPPSFGRSKTDTFKIQKDWNSLLSACTKVLSKDGQLYFSTNFENWNQQDFKKNMQRFSLENNLKIQSYFSAPNDFNSEILKTVLFSN